MAISAPNWQNSRKFTGILNSVATPNQKPAETVRLHPNIGIEEIQALVRQDMARVNAYIQQNLHSEIVLINQLGHYIVNSGGKRLRPALLLLSARCFSYSGEDHIKLAAILEFIHTATLLHDDVVDASKLRRGRETANQLWGNEASVLVGDFLYSRAFQMMVDVNSMRVMEILSTTTNQIAEGEVQQLMNAHDPATTEERYLNVIRNKTARLFEAAAQLGAIIAGRPADEEANMAAYGCHLGTAFQLIDDTLDYSASSKQLGKNIGDDLAEGKPTLPLLYALWHGNEKQARIIRNAITNGGLENIKAIQQAIAETGAIEYTAALAKSESEKAIESLRQFPASPYIEALVALARFSVERDY